MRVSVALRPRERRRPRMPNQLSPLVEQRIVAFALGHPGLGPRRIAAELARPRWAGLLVSANGVWLCLRRHGLNSVRSASRCCLGDAAPYEPPRPAPVPQHVEAKRPGELVGFDCFFVGRLHNMKQTAWQLTAIDVCSSYAWAELVPARTANPNAAQTSKSQDASRPSCKRPAGGSSGRSPTTAASFAAASNRQSPSSTREQLATAWLPANKRRRRSATQDDPRRVLAPRIRPLPPGPLPRATTRPDRLPSLLQQRTRPHRPTHPRSHPHRHRLRCPQMETR